MEVQKCNTPGSLTKKVPVRRVASTLATDNADVRLKAESSSDRAKKVFLQHMEELMRPFEAFGECLWYLPSAPAMVPCVSQPKCYENALLDMVDQSLTFLYRFAVSYAARRMHQA